jgi:hypothetical protein
LPASTRSPSRGSAKPARNATIFTHNGAPSAQVGCLGQRRWPVERSNAWVLENKRLALRYDRLGFIIQSLLQTACIFLVAGRLARQF